MVSVWSVVLKIVLFANTDWFLYNFRLSLAFALKNAGHDVLMLTPAGPYGEKFLKAGFRWVEVPMDRRSLNPFRELFFLLWFIRFLRRERIDLIHSFTLKCVIYGALAAKVAGVKRRISGVDGLGYVFLSSDLKARLLKPVVLSLMRLALRGDGSRLVLLNRDDVTFFESSGLIPASQILFIPGAGVNCARFRGRRMSVPPGEPVRVLLAARMLWDKGVGEYIDAARILHGRRRRIQFLLAGNPDVGNPSSILESQIKAWVTEGVVEWLGHVSDMPSLLASVDIAVLPSYREGLPTSLIEAGACGLPLVTTNAPGCREVVTNEVDGLLVEPKNPLDLADAIDRLLLSPDLASRLGEAAKKKVRQTFEESIVIRDTLKVYEGLEA